MKRDSRYLEYYRARAKQEREAAAEAFDDQTRRIHLDLAKRYAKLAKSLEVAD